MADGNIESFDKTGVRGSFYFSEHREVKVGESTIESQKSSYREGNKQCLTRDILPWDFVQIGRVLSGGNGGGVLHSVMALL